MSVHIDVNPAGTIDREHVVTIKLRGLDTRQLAAFVSDLEAATAPEVITVDSAGIGAAVSDYLREHQRFTLTQFIDYYRANGGTPENAAELGFQLFKEERHRRFGFRS